MLATFDPTFAVFVSSHFSQLVEGGPVHCMIVGELDITTNCFHQLVRRHELTQILVELELLSCNGIDEWCNQLEECFDY